MGAIKVGATKVGATKVGAAKVGAAKVGATKEGATMVGLMIKSTVTRMNASVVQQRAGEVPGKPYKSPFINQIGIKVGTK